MAMIRAFTESDWTHLWPILQAAILTGDTLAYDPDSSEAEMRQAWIDVPTATFVACDADGSLLGSYFMKPNQPGLGSHVCNAGYVVAQAARGRGTAAALCEHSQREASGRGFRAMQFNFVVSTNERAVRLWQRLGFAIVGTVPGGFQHRTRGFVDTLVMFKPLA